MLFIKYTVLDKFTTITDKLLHPIIDFMNNCHARIQSPNSSKKKNPPPMGLQIYIHGRGTVNNFIKFFQVAVTVKYSMINIFWRTRLEINTIRTILLLLTNS